jgi:ribosomal protein L12E/L44/L45/RPP1/RPP2
MWSTAPGEGATKACSAEIHRKEEEKKKEEKEEERGGVWGGNPQMRATQKYA